jgi:hypothetical protein
MIGQKIVTGLEIFKSMATYLLLVIRGLEFLVIEEIESKLQVGQ